MNFMNPGLRLCRHQATEGTGHSTPVIETDKKFQGWQRMYHRDKYARDRIMKSARLLLPYLKDGDTVLDVGCYTQEAKKYYPRTVKYVGLDGTAYHPQSQVVDLNHGFSPVSANHALCLETLEHLVDPADCLESLCDSLAANGALVVSVPNEITLFHRMRCLCGIADAQCFASEGKHLHLPSLKQSRKFLTTRFDIVSEQYYISPSAVGSSQQWIGRILGLIPDGVHQILADRLPSLFARGFIFLLKKKGATLGAGDAQSSQSRPSPLRPQKIDVSGKNGSDSPRSP